MTGLPLIQLNASSFHHKHFSKLVSQALCFIITPCLNGPSIRPTLFDSFSHAFTNAPFVDLAVCLVIFPMLLLEGLLTGLAPCLHITHPTSKTGTLSIQPSIPPVLNASRGRPYTKLTNSPTLCCPLFPMSFKVGFPLIWRCAL